MFLPILHVRYKEEEEEEAQLSPAHLGGKTIRRPYRLLSTRLVFPGTVGEPRQFTDDLSTFTVSMLRPFRILTLASYVLKEKLSRKSEVNRRRSHECATDPEPVSGTKRFQKHTLVHILALKLIV